MHREAQSKTCRLELHFGKAKLLDCASPLALS